MANQSLLGSYGDISGSGLMFRNKLINGGFDIWQRGTSQTSSGYGSDDRWLNAHAGSTKTASRQTFTLGQTDVPANPTYFARTVVTLAGSPATSDFVLKRQNIEYVKTLAGQTATLSFWAKADASKNMAVEFAQSFGTGGSPSAQVSAISVTTFALTSSWKYFTATVNLPSISGKTIGSNSDDYVQMNLWLSAGSDFNARTNSLGQQSGTFDIANVQLEAGPVATPFEQRPIGMEQGLCERYYQKIDIIKWWSYSSAGNPTGYAVTFPTMRTAPNVTGSFGYANSSGGTLETISKNAFRILASTTVTGTLSVTYTNVELTAEL